LLHHNGLHEEDADAFLEKRGVMSSLEPTREIGNIYSGSAYLALAFMLKQQYEARGADIVGKKVLLGSYGSGNTMSVFTARIAREAPAVISNWDLDSVIADGVEESLQHYERWLRMPFSAEEYREVLAEEQVPTGRFYLQNIRDDGYREYARA
jgi:hydroxymethylglutaryl-CoA synthase